MKNSLTKKHTAALLCLSLIVSVFAFSVSASGDALSAFIQATESIDTALTLTEKEEYLIAAAENLDLYVAGGGSVEDEEIADTYASYIAKKEEIEAKIAVCAEFMEYVDLAVYGEGSFTETVAYLDLAQALLDKIDETYLGVAGAKADYNELRSKLYAPIEICRGYINAAKAAAEATTYGEAAQHYNTALTYRALITITDYPGLDEAEANLIIADAFMSERLKNAQGFIIAVKNISKAESIPKGIAEAYEIFERDGVDETAEGAASAMSELQMLEATYNRNVKRANGDVDEINSFLFSFIF